MICFSWHQLLKFDLLALSCLSLTTFKTISILISKLIMSALIQQRKTRKWSLLFLLFFNSSELHLKGRRNYLAKRPAMSLHNWDDLICKLATNEPWDVNYLKSKTPVVLTEDEYMQILDLFTSTWTATWIRTITITWLEPAISCSQDSRWVSIYQILSIIPSWIEKDCSMNS